MRPPSIVMFERLFLASLALSVVSFFVNYNSMTEELANTPGVEQLGIGGGFLIGSMVVGLVIYLLLWFFIARKASNVAKWILVVLLALSLISIPGLLAGPWNLSALFGLAIYALELAAAVYLFQSDAKAWLSGEWNADPSTFD